MSASKTIIQLGRYGDIMNVLPLCWSDAQASNRRSLMVASEFSGLLDGVSYVDPVIYDGHYSAINLAAEKAETMGQEWVCSQVNGPIELVREYTYEPTGHAHARTPSYQKEMWRVLGRLDDWEKNLPLVFDKRDREREEELFNRYVPRIKGKRRKPLILISTEGTSSPFKEGNLLYELLKLKFAKQFHLVDLAPIRAFRLYDLLVLYERAHCLVAIDSAPLHLARAIPRLPVVALANDKPLLWNGSAWMPSYTFYCRYSDFSARSTELLSFVEQPTWPGPATAPAIVHLFSMYEPKRAVIRAYGPDWLPTPVTLGMCGRETSNTGISDQRYPFLKDCLKIGLQRARDVDFVCLTRPDTIFMTPEATAQFTAQDACYAYRVNRDARTDTHQPIVDLFCARKAFWQKLLPEIPPMVLSNDYFWSHALFALFSQRGATMLPRAVYRVAA